MFLMGLVVLTAVGIAMVYSTTIGTFRADLWSRQLLFAGLGLAAAAVLVSIDYRILLQYSPWMYGASLLVLVYLLLLGPRIAGPQSWIRLAGGSQIQPSEFVKLSVALLLTWVLENDDRTYASGK